MSTNKPRLLLISGVLPVPIKAGQNARVFNKIRAFRKQFHVTFLGFSAESRHKQISQEMANWVDEVVILPSISQKQFMSRVWHKGVGELYALWHGLKPSNYILGHVELSPARITKFCEGKPFDLVVYEYWHTAASLPYFKSRGIPCVIDMHNILWQSYVRQLSERPWPDWLRQRQISKYKQAEEAAWTQYDGLITINSGEHDYVKKIMPNKPLFYAPMGLDMEQWPYQWTPQNRPRVGYYGGLSGPHNQAHARFCYEQVMPHVWQHFPDAEFWIVGSNPPDHLRQLAKNDKRVTVTGFVEDVQTVLKTMSVALCPWHGRYGFRSRVVELMAVGIPTIVNGDAVYGMPLETENGLFIRESGSEMAEVITNLLNSPTEAQRQSYAARQQVVELYNFTTTYESLAQELVAFTQSL